MQLPVLLPQVPMSCQTSHRPGKPRSKDSEVSWSYVTQLETMRKDVDRNSQGLQNIESDVRGLQWRISLATDSLVRRIEILECGNESQVNQDRGHTVPVTTQKWWSNDVVGRFDALEATVKDLQDCFHSCSSEILAQSSSLALVQESLALVQELHMQAGGHAFHPLDASEAWLESDPSHFMCLERLQENWDEIDAATNSGDGAEPLEGIANGTSAVTLLQVGKIGSESWSASNTTLGSAASVFGHKASRFQLRRSQLQDTQQRTLDFVPQRADACDGETTMAAAVGPCLGKGNPVSSGGVDSHTLHL